MHLCAELIAVTMMLEPLGEVGANFSLQLVTKINNKKVNTENQCEKHRKIEFRDVYAPIRPSNSPTGSVRYEPIIPQVQFATHLLAQ